MKKIVSLLGIVALSAAAFTACNKVSENDIQKEGKHTVKFTPVLNDTRTVISEEGEFITFKWVETDVDKFHVWENGIKGLTEAELSQDNTIATITGVFNDTQATSFEYASCYAAEVDDSGNPVILATQNAGPTSFDQDADILIGENITATSPKQELLVSFTRPVALVKMNLKGLESGETVSSVQVKSNDGKLTGTYNRAENAFDFTDGEETITISLSGVNVSDAGTAPVYFVCAPIENKILSIEVWTSMGGDDMSGRHYIKQFAQGITFPANNLTRFTANLTCCEAIEGGAEEVTIFKETFDKTEGTGGNDGKWNGSIASKRIIDDNDGWFYSNEGGGYKCIKMGTSSAKGSAITPALGITAETATITFKAAAWDQEDATISLEVPEGVTISSISPNATLTKGEWGTYTATITGANENTEIVFKASKNRFFLDEVEVKEVRVNDPNTVHLDVADNTEINGSQTEATVAIMSNKAWTVTSSDELLASIPISINGTKETTSFKVNFAAANTSVTETKVATLHVKAGAGTYAVEKDITVTQKPVTAYINISDDEKTQTVAASATSATFSVTNCNFDWDVVSVTVDGVADDAYTATKGENGIVTVSFPSNEAATGETTLNKVIVVTVGDADIKTNACTITQQGETNVDPNKRYYVKVTDNQTDWTGNYLIVSGNSALPGETISGKTHTPITVSPAGNMIEATSTLKLNSVNISQGSGSGKWYIRGLSGYYGGSSTSFLVQNSGIDNEIAIADGILSIKSNDVYLRFNSSASTGPFRYYGSLGTGSDIELYKYNGESEELSLGQLSVGDIQVNAGNGTLSFSWDAVTGATGYLVYWNGSTTAEERTNDMALTFTKTDLQNGTPYYIEVVAVGDGIFYTTSVKKKSPNGTPVAGSGNPDSDEWDLTTGTYTSVSEDLIEWESNETTVSVAKNGGTKVNNYLGGTGSNNHTRFYNNNIISIIPKTGVTITSVVITCTGSSYTTYIAGNWDNATASADGTVITITPTNGATALSHTITGTTRVSEIVVNYEK